MLFHVTSARVLASALVGLALGAAGCAHPADAQLHQVTGELFSLHSVRDQPFRSGPFAPESTAEARFAQLTARFGERLRGAHTPGGALAVVVDGQLRFSAGVGLLRADGALPVHAETLFRTASISKMLVAAAALSLAERGQLDLAAPAAKSVPYFLRGHGHDASQVTLAMALAHTAGLPEDTHGCADSPYGLEDYFRKHAQDPLWSAPGTLFNYSNIHYALVAAALHESTGTPFEQVVAERVFAPAGMVSATYGPGPLAELARGHAEDGSLVPADLPDCETSRAAGGVFASAIDFAHFVETLLMHGGAMLSPASVEAMTSEHALMQAAPPQSYGYGLISSELLGMRLLAHTGAALGFRSAVLMAPERGFGVVVFVNGSMDPMGTAYGALAAFLDLPEVFPPRVLTEPASWQQYAGTYRDAWGGLGRFRVYLQEDKLRLELLGGQQEAIPAMLSGRFDTDTRSVMRFVTRIGVAQREPLDAAAP
jgi:CubicO group peptidase (beta-lactamase class C family)